MAQFGFIGDSLTIGFGLSGDAPPAIMCATLSTDTNPISANNQGSNGTSTSDWASGPLLTNALNSFSGAAVKTVLIMLGTNDCKPWIGITPAQYKSNIQQIINALKGIGVQQIVLNQPPYIQPSGTGIPDPTTENATLVQYQSELSMLSAADPSHVFLGDQAAFMTFHAHSEYYQADGIHPNDTGAAALAQLWVTGYQNLTGVTQTMANDPIIQPGAGSGPSTPAAGSVVPASISQGASNDFVFPRDVTSGRNWIGPNGMKFIPLADGTAAIEFTQADGSTVVLQIDTQNIRFGFGAGSLSVLVNIHGNMRCDGQFAMGPATPSAACLIDMVNPFVGLGVPVMTTTQKNAVSPNRAGNVVFDTTLGKLCVNNGSAWETISSS